jgi:hypothetical protein
LTIISGIVGEIRLFIGLKSINFSLSTNEKSKLHNIEGPVYLAIVSANVFPKQILLPPKNGAKL